ncbi:hypothetical protein AA313_de0210390 [Arthrobotrys entomopaga]|nr:hypothetical protein AA313_de0210390 [Arthrobotrys entomopaga]
MHGGWVPCPYCGGRRCRYCNYCGYVQGSSGIPGLEHEILSDEDIQQVDENEVESEYATDEIKPQFFGFDPATHT